MARYIEEKELMEWIQNWFEKNRYYHPYSKSNDIPIPELYDILEQMPSADLVERKVGKWLESNESISRPYMCSNCGCLYDVDTIMGKLCWKYCPNCGAEMEENNGKVH